MNVIDRNQFDLAENILEIKIQQPRGGHSRIMSPRICGYCHTMEILGIPLLSMYWITQKSSSSLL